MSDPPHVTGSVFPPSLETADAVARAAHLWIRNLRLPDMTDAAEKIALAGGLVHELCDKLELEPRIRDLVAYVYTMLDGQTETSLAVARLMLAGPESTGFHKAYGRGRSEALAIVEMISCNDNG